MLSLCPYLRWPVLAVARQVCCPIALFWVSCHLARLALTPPKGPLVAGPRHDSLIFTQGRGIQLSGGCLGHQPRLEQAGKVAVQAGRCLDMVPVVPPQSGECPPATKALKPRLPKARVSHHTHSTPPSSQTLEQDQELPCQLFLCDKSRQNISEI